MRQQIAGTVQTDRLIQAAAARQHGVVARSQLIEAGVPGRRIDYRVSCGLLTPIYRGVYSTGPLIGHLARPFAAVLAAGPASFVSHRAAAGVLGMLPSPGECVPVEISTTRDVRIRAAGIRIYRVSRLDADEVMLRHGLPVTKPARTLLDLGAVTERWELERALATALRNRWVELPTLQALMARHRRRPGRGRLRALLAMGGGPAFTRSEAERRFLDLVRQSGLPPPESNVVVEGLEVDFLWRTERLIVEVDGREYHTGSHAFEQDRDRDGILIAAGYRTMRVTWRQIAHRPNSLLVRLAQALAR